MSTTASRVPEPASAPDDLGAVQTALDAAVNQLRSQQQPDGWWKGALDTNVTMDAEDLLMRAFLDILTPEATVPTARWIRSQQRADGSWSVYPGGPGDHSTSAEAWVALRLAGDGPRCAPRSGRVCARRRWGRKQPRIHANMVFALRFMVLG